MWLQTAFKYLMIIVLICITGSLVYELSRNLYSWSVWWLFDRNPIVLTGTPTSIHELTGRYRGTQRFRFRSNEDKIYAFDSNISKNALREIRNSKTDLTIKYYLFPSLGKPQIFYIKNREKVFHQTAFVDSGWVVIGGLVVFAISITTFLFLIIAFVTHLKSLFINSDSN